MIPRLAKVREIAERFRVSADAVYLWIRQGKIPAECVARIAGTIRVDEDEFERRLRSGSLCQPRGRKRTAANDEADESLASAIADDSRSTIRTGGDTEHRWTGEGGRVHPEHPFSPEMVMSILRTNSPPEPSRTAGSGRITVLEIARRLNFGRVAVYVMLQQDIIPGVRIGRRWIVTRHAYEQWERTCGTRPDAGLGPKPEVMVLN